MPQATYEYTLPDANWQPVTVRMTEGEILAFYWDYWSDSMRRQGKRGINPERCVDDFVTVHWATKIEETQP